MTNPFVNFVAFQLAWFACVTSAAAGFPWIGPLVVGVFLATHLVMAPAHRRSDSLLVLLSAAAGYLADSLVVQMGWLAFPSQAQFGAPSTIWMVSLWVAFALTLRHSLRWLRHRYVLSAVLGAVFGPIAYLAGWRLGAIEITSVSASTIVFAIEWMVMMPFLVVAADCVEDIRLADTGSRCL